MEEVVDLEADNDEVFKHPWIYAVETGHWDLPEDQAAKLREYLARGGFLMTDDFHGTAEWEVFMASLREVFPKRPVVDIDNDDPIFHVLYDLDDRFQVPGIQFLRSDAPMSKDGFEPEWKAVRDDQEQSHGRHLPQYGLGRRLGMGRPSPDVSGAVCFAGLSCRSQLHRLLNDPLRRGRDAR